MEHNDIQKEPPAEMQGKLFLSNKTHFSWLSD